MATRKTPTYESLQIQIDALRKQAETLRQREIKEVIVRIKDAIKVYELAPEDLGFVRQTPAAPRPAGAGQRKVNENFEKRSRAGMKVAPKFRDAAGNVWSGRGSRPRWLRSALEAGHKLEEFAV